MTYYRIIATPKGPLATDLISGTLWGHMAWAIRYLEGEQRLRQWLQEQESEPWLISSQMPKNMIPRPNLKPLGKTGTLDTLESIITYKKIKKRQFISEDSFLKTRHGMNEAALVDTLGSKTQADESNFVPVRLAHNTINRHTGRTPEEGGLYFEDAHQPTNDAQIQFFLQTPQPCDAQLEQLLTYIGTNGYGANASIGYGIIHFKIEEETALFALSGNRAMSLSHGILTENMNGAKYRQHTHFGKLGGHFAMSCHSPFKHPIFMMQPGATFTPKGGGPFGALLSGVHHSPDLQTLRHHALHLPIYFTEAAE